MGSVLMICLIKLWKPVAQDITCLLKVLLRHRYHGSCASLRVLFVRFTSHSTDRQADDRLAAVLRTPNDTETWREPHFCRIPWRNAANRQNHTCLIGIRPDTECPKLLIKIYVFWESYLCNLCYAYSLYIKARFSLRDVTSRSPISMVN